MTPADDDDSLRHGESPDEPDDRERSESEGDEHAADGDDGDDIEIVGFSAADEAGVAIEDPDDFDEPGDDDEEEIVLLDDDEGEDGDDASTPPADDETVRALRDELQAARDEAEEVKQRLVRQAAEADNFRKRVERERVEERKQAAAGLVRDLLPILDNFERALEQGREKAEEDSSVSSFLDGFRLIEEQLSDILRRAGLEPVDAAGTFDPNVHEALMQEPTTDAPHLSVLKVFEQGWRFQGRLLRPARVVVASNPDAGRGGEVGEVGEVGQAGADGGGPDAPDSEAGDDAGDAGGGGGNTTDGSDEGDGDERAASRGETD